MNDLSKMIQAAFEQPDLYKHDFLTAVRDSDLIVPLIEKFAKGTGFDPIQKKDKLDLKLITLEDEKLALPIFSSQETFSRFLEFNEGDSYIHYSGLELFKLACAESLQVVLDPMGPHAYEFSEDEIDILSEDPCEEHQSIDSFDQFKMREVEIHDPKLFSDLEGLLRKDPSIKEAYLLELSLEKTEKGNSEYKLCLGLYLNDDMFSEEEVARPFQAILNEYHLHLIAFNDARILKSFSDATTAFYFGW